MIPTPLDSHRSALNEFARIVWGNSQAILKQHPGGFEFIDLGAFFPAFYSLFAGISLPDKLLVRNEYRMASQALETDAYKSGAYVTGQPGIGKTLFLLYLLVLRLGQRKPVAVQFLGSKEFYAFFKDTVGFHSFRNDAKLLLEGPAVWALCDSNQYITTPGSIFASRRVRIIQTTSPTASRWRGWSKQLGAKPYIMDIWSEEEVVQLAMLLGLDVHRMKTLAEKWGNVPRSLVRNFGVDDQEIEARYRHGAPFTVRVSQTVMSEGPLLNFSDDPPSMFYFLRPMTTTTGALHRGFSYLYVPTRTLRRILAEALEGFDNATKPQFYNALSYYPNTRQAASFIFENWFHSYFIVEKRITCCWDRRPSARPSVRFPSRVGIRRGEADLILATQDAPRTATPPYYWISPSDFPGIDSALVLENQILAFQVTLRSPDSIESPIDGLECLRNMLPRELKNIAWKMVFVGPEEDHNEYVARYWHGRLFFPTKHKRLLVGWSAVDPTQYGVKYREYCDEPEPAPYLMEIDE